MQIQFQTRGVSGWKGPGRPHRQPSERALNALRGTAQGKVAVIVLDGTVTADDLRELRLDLRAAARVLGGKVHTQKIDGKFLFYWERES